MDRGVSSCLPLIVAVAACTVPHSHETASSATGQNIATPAQVDTMNATDGAETAPAPSCGQMGLLDCPLQGWMRTNAAGAMRDHDAARLERVFGTIAEFGPPEFGSWRTMAGAGRRAAVAGDLETCRKVCKDCHDTYRGDYRRTRRAENLQVKDLVGASVGAVNFDGPGPSRP